MTSSPFLDPEKDLDKERRRLPHWQQGHVWQFVTWRLADSLPRDLLLQWQSERAAWIARHPEPWNDAIAGEYGALFTDRIELLLDAGHGSCVLSRPHVEGVVEECLRHFDGERYRLGPFIVMPNHVHVLFQPLSNHRLDKVLHGWKSYTAKAINLLLGVEGSLWQEDYWDRLIRSEKHWFAVMRYIERNPACLPPGSYILGYGSGKEP